MTPNDSDQNDLHRTLGRFEAKLDELLRKAEAQEILNTATILRVTSLEAWRAYLTGGMVIISGLLAVLVKYISILV